MEPMEGNSIAPKVEPGFSGQHVVWWFCLVKCNVLLAMILFCWGTYTLRQNCLPYVILSIYIECFVFGYTHVMDGKRVSLIIKPHEQYWTHSNQAIYSLSAVR